MVDEKEKEMTAYHEAGHALVQVLLPDADPLHKVSIIPRGQMGGATFSLPERDRHLYTRKWCEAFLRICVAGRIAEEVFCGDVDSGAASDIAQATELARKMVKDWGMSDRLGFVRYAGDPSGGFADLAGKEYSEQTAETIDQEVRSILEVANRDTRQMIEKKKEALGNIAQALLKYETLEADEVKRIMDGEVIDKPTVDDLLQAEEAKTAAGSRPEEAADTPEAEPPPGTVPEPS
jgi:cell division protease FtsH